MRNAGGSPYEELGDAKVMPRSRMPIVFFLLVGSVVGALLWCASYFNFDYITSSDEHGTACGVIVGLHAGAITWFHSGKAADVKVVYFVETSGLNCNGYRGMKTYWMPKFRVSPSGAVYSFAIPLWMPIFLSATLLPWSFVSARRCKRRELGECLKCGYSLHGLTEPRCPECGTPFEMSKLKEADSQQPDIKP